MADDKKYVKLLEDYILLQQKTDGIIEKNSKLINDLDYAQKKIQSLKMFTDSERPIQKNVLDDLGEISGTKDICPNCNCDVDKNENNFCGKCGQKIYRF